MGAQKINPGALAGTTGVRVSKTTLGDQYYRPFPSESPAVLYARVVDTVFRPATPSEIGAALRRLAALRRGRA